MGRPLTLNSSFLLGFDEIERTFERSSRTASDGYPPYNIERIVATTTKTARLRITLAVAGFTADQLEIIVEEARLLIHGRQRDEKERIHLHRGIAARQFQRVFRFAEAMRVASAALEHGLLSIELIRPEPERTAQKIDVQTINIMVRD